MPKSAFLLCTVAILIVAPGCPKQKKQAAPATSQPGDVQKTAPAKTQQPPATLPAATQPTASQPVTTRPASTYDPKPPYPVELYVIDPDEKQPGWIRIMELANDKATATSEATFPEQNRIYIKTDNVQRLRIHIKHLPLNRRQRTVLRIDEQPMVLSTQKKREYVFLNRLSTGEWVVEPESKE